MSGLLRGSPRGLAAVRMALSGAAVSLALAHLAPAHEALPFFCDDDTTNHQFHLRRQCRDDQCHRVDAVGDGANAQRRPK